MAPSQVLGAGVAGDKKIEIGRLIDQAVELAEEFKMAFTEVEPRERAFVRQGLEANDTY